MPSELPPKEKLRQSIVHEFSKKISIVRWTRTSAIIFAAIVILALANLALNAAALFHH